MSEKWADAVREAGEDPPADLGAAVREELACLWTDLDQAVHYALRGGWSMGCDWVTARIVRLPRIAGATPWEQVPIPLVLDGTWQGILAASGITCEPPGPDGVRAMREWREAQALRVPGG
jgi:hypothetical protein